MLLPFSLQDSDTLSCIFFSVGVGWGVGGGGVSLLEKFIRRPPFNAKSSWMWCGIEVEAFPRTQPTLPHPHRKKDLLKNSSGWVVESWQVPVSQKVCVQLPLQSQSLCHSQRRSTQLSRSNRLRVSLGGRRFHSSKVQPQNLWCL